MTTSPARTPRRSAFLSGVHALRLRPRLVTGFVVSALVDLLLPSSYEMQTRLLIGWNAGIALYLAMTWTMMASSDVHRLRQRAARHDEGEWTIILLAMAASLASLVAIAVELNHARTGDAYQGARVALAAATIFVSWFFIHTIMAQHYAHDYYLREGTGPGLIFPGSTPEPSYWDFAYFAFTIGVAAQTADIAIASPRIRRVALAHAVLSFLYNTAILALAINVGASLL